MIKVGVSNFMEALLYIFINSLPLQSHRRTEASYTPPISFPVARSDQTKFMNRDMADYNHRKRKNGGLGGRGG